MDITSNFSKEQLLNMFLSFYDTDYWITKIRTLQLLIEDEELLKKVSQDEVLKKFDKEKLKRSYQYELHMASYHSSEALFGLIFAFLFQKETPWVYLTEYRFDEFNKLVGDIKERGFASIIKEDEDTYTVEYNGEEVTINKAEMAPASAACAAAAVMPTVIVLTFTPSAARWLRTVSVTGPLRLLR